ncbi:MULTISPECIES: MipA/OmpV family protein [Silvimonas]|uniref:MipA/OmpV family protein n=1 Tax=Silvimonas TaxID=300264 RepID=UPI0024B3BDCA|nr:MULTISPECIES: MipA/OmpV family protein [Silvimonas]MDR3428944.1 MipA/OmpV family protein [Silvimonas sp.]
MLLRARRLVVGKLCAGLLALAGLLAPVANAIDLPPAPNLFGIGVGVTTQCSGCKDTYVGAVPGLNYRGDGWLVEWYGPYAQFDLGKTGSGFRWGPALNVKLGRSDLDDPVLRRLPDIDTTLEVGGFVGYQYLSGGDIPYRFRLYANILTNGGQVYDGVRGAVQASIWAPASPQWLFGLGLGYGWASKSFMNTYYGVDEAASQASGLPVFSANSGNQQVYGWLGAIYFINKHWAVGTAVIDQRLIGSAADTPIVTQRGTANQLTYGVGLGYLW